jgi:hypothetical protein
MRVLLWFGLVVPLACGGCPSSDEEAKPSNAEVPSSPAADADATAKSTGLPAEPKPSVEPKVVSIEPSEPPKIELLEAGENPKQMLRFEPPLQTEHMKMTMNMKMGMKGPGGEVPVMQMPPVVAKGTSTVEKIVGDDIHVRQEIASLEVEAVEGIPANVVDAMRSQLEGFSSYGAQIVIDKRGVLEHGEARVPQSLPPQMSQMLEQMAKNFGQLQIPMPEEAVGKGARWTAVSRMEQGGLQLEQTAKYHLVEIAGSRLGLDVKLEQTLLEKTFSPPGATGATATIDDFSSSGKGHMQIDLTKLVPTTSELDMSTRFAMEIEMMGERQKQDMDMAILMRIERVEPGSK